LKTVSDETLTDYIFDLLEPSDKKFVEKAIQSDSNVSERHNSLRGKFSQLNLIEDEVATQSNKTIRFSLIYSLAAVLLLSFFIPNFYKESPNASIDTASANLEVNMKTNLLDETELVSDRSLLLSSSETPILDSFKFEVPEITIQYENEDYEIVDLQEYGTLQLPTEPSPDLINPNLILISYIQ